MVLIAMLTLEDIQCLKSFSEDFNHYIEFVCAFLEDLRYASGICCLSQEDHCAGLVLAEGRILLSKRSEC